MCPSSDIVMLNLSFAMAASEWVVVWVGRPRPLNLIRRPAALA
jgi:hypothetical protein